MFNNRNSSTMVIIILSIIVLYFLADNSLVEKKDIEPLLTENNIELLKKEDNKLSEESDIKWLTYTDNRYGYSVDFPDYVDDVSTTYEHAVKKAESLGGGYLTTNGGVKFGNKGYPGGINVYVFENTEFKNVDEWLTFKNNMFDYPRKALEEKLLINGYEAITIHEMGGIDKQTEEHFVNDKTLVVIKDNTLFEIHTRFGLELEYTKQHKKVWDSLKFISNEE